MPITPEERYGLPQQEDTRRRLGLDSGGGWQQSIPRSAVIGNTADRAVRAVEGFAGALPGAEGTAGGPIGTDMMGDVVPDSKWGAGAAAASVLPFGRLAQGAGKLARGAEEMAPPSAHAIKRTIAAIKNLPSIKPSLPKFGAEFEAERYLKHYWPGVPLDEVPIHITPIIGKPRVEMKRWLGDRFETLYDVARRTDPQWKALPEAEAKARWAEKVRKEISEYNAKNDRFKAEYNQRKLQLVK